MTILEQIIQQPKPCWIGSPQGPHYLCAAVYAVENNNTTIKIANGLFGGGYPTPIIIDVPLSLIAYTAESIQLGM